MFRNVLIIFLITFVMTGCARKQLQPTVSLEEFEQSAENTVDQSDAQYIPQGTFASAQSAVVGTNLTDYLLGAGDLMTISVYEEEKLNTEVRVSSRGEITMPLLGSVYVMGLTASEAEEKIERALEKDYMHQAHVSLFVKERVSQQITLVGAVQHPGTYETKATKRILEVLAMAGGLTSAAGDIAYVTRHKGDEKENQVFLVDIEELVENGRVDLNMFVQGGDVVFIPQCDVVQVDGAVWQPGAVKIDGKMTVDEAIAAAGGLAQYADDEDIKIIRKTQDGKRQIIQLSMDEVLSMKKKNGSAVKNDLWNEHPLLLQDGDVIFVEASGSRSFYSGVGFSLGFMGTGMTYKNPVQYRSQVVRNQDQVK